MDGTVTLKMPCRVWGHDAKGGPLNGFSKCDEYRWTHCRRTLLKREAEREICGELIEMGGAW